MRPFALLAVFVLGGLVIWRLTALDQTTAKAVDTPASVLPSADWSNKVGLQTGKTDYPYPFEPEAIQIIVAPGVDIAAALAPYGVSGPVAYANRLPFTDFDRGAGLDRSFRVAVPAGSEKDTVVRLAQDHARFVYVGLFWIAPVQLGTQ